VTATILQFPKRHRFAIVVHHDERDGWYVLRGCYGWLHGDIARAFEDAQELARADSVAIVVRP
jgi:hypothetical protein